MPGRAPTPVPLAGPPAGLSGLDLSRWVIDVCTRGEEQGGLGFTCAGVCGAEPPPIADVDALRGWLDRAEHGSMAYMAEQFTDRLDPQRVLAGAQSVVMVADRYAPRAGTADDAAAAERSDGVPRGRIARYARGRDYHTTIKRRLHRLADALRAAFPAEAFRSFTDTAPVLERRFAQRAGLGWLAKNAMLIHPVHGSWLLLGGFLTTLKLPTPPDADQPLFTDHCGACTRCIDACPTGAIARQPLEKGERARVDATRCISYLTIEHEGVIDPALAGRAQDWVFGCDICQEVCPHNSPRPSAVAGAVRADYAAKRATLPLLEMAKWERADRSLLTVSAMKRATAEMFRRNAAVALANEWRRTSDPALRAALEELRNDPAPLISSTAGLALG
ncbi:MAG TPA: tRNA epoxyqueuosine(34) reductase QueG [Phycisphaerales bacterium]|nr:tRNA epoxyqueuosine(34) reductase QueG [Phycisphaerales bacterium]